MKRDTPWLAAALTGVAWAQAVSPSTVVVRVPAQANPYLAGMPNGARVIWNDRAPQQSPLLVPLDLTGAVAVTFLATGAMSHGPQTCPPFCSGPDGAMMTDHQSGAENGIANVKAPYESVVGVFLDDARPDRSKAPKRLDFQDIGLKFVSLAPELKQIFFIGTGKTKAGAVRRYAVPKGATRLYLGTMDCYQWNNNTGSFVVAATLEREDVSSRMLSTDSDIRYQKWACMPDRNPCTPEEGIVEMKEAGRYHVVLPAHLEWGASVPTPSGSKVNVGVATGTVCLDFAGQGAISCHGAEGDRKRAGEGFLKPEEAAGALVWKVQGGRIYFSVNDRSGDAFRAHGGWFEFDVNVAEK